MLLLMRRILSLVAGIGIVAGIWSGLGVIEERFRRDRLPEGWDHLDPPGEVCALLQDPLKPDCLWTGGRDGLILVNMKQRCRLPPLPGQPGLERVWTLENDDSGRVWIGSEKGLFLFDVSSRQWLHVGDAAPRGAVHCLLFSRSGFLYAGGPGGLFVFDRFSWKRMEIPEEFRLPSIDVLYEEIPSGRLWAGSSAAPDGGLLSFSAGKWRRHPVGPEIPHPSVNMITRDHRGRLLFATGFASHGGVACLEGDRWKLWESVDELAGKKIRSVFEDSSGRLWFGSEYDGLAILNPEGDWIRIRPGAGLAGREVKQVLEESPGIYWLGTDRGLSRILLPPPG